MGVKVEGIVTQAAAWSWGMTPLVMSRLSAWQSGLRIARPLWRRFCKLAEAGQIQLWRIKRGSFCRREMW